MKISCQTNKLKSALGKAVKVASVNAILPSLQGILLKTKDGSLECLATNLDTTLKLDVECHVSTEGSVCVLARTINEVLQVMTGDEVELEMSENLLKIHSGSFQGQVETLPVDEFPQIPEPETVGGVKLEASVIKNAMNKVLFAVSNSETQPEISSVLLRLIDDSIVLVATDRYRLAECRLSGVGQTSSQDVLFPGRSALELLRLLEADVGSVEFGFTEQTLWWKWEGVRFFSKVVDGQYPAYEQILQMEEAVSLSVSKQELLSAVKAVGVFARSSGHVRLTFNEDGLEVSGGGGSEGKGQSSIAAKASSSGGFLMNLRYLQDGLSALSGNTALFTTASETSPIKLVDPEDGSYIYIIMPIRG